MSTKRAHIIGCGISGPVLAMYLDRAGYEAVVHERRTEAMASEGASFNLAPNGLDVLRTLGLAEEVEAVGNRTDRIGFYNHRGKQLGLNPESTVLLNRGDLQKVLVSGAERAGVRLEFGKLLTDVTQTPDAVTATFADGTSVEGDLLVGCDGLRSRVRHAVVPTAPVPTYSGIIDCAGLGYLPGRLPADGVMRMTFGLRGFFGYQALADGHVFWFENSPVPQEPDRRELKAIPHDVFRRRLLDIHRDDEPTINEIIASTDEIERWSAYEAPQVERWGRGRVAIVGDAAHAMGPHTGQGASMALEDSIVLARCVRDLPDVPSALAAFEAERKPRVVDVIRQTRQTGNQKSPGAVGRAIRDLVLPIFLRKQVGRTTDLYDFHIPW